jgi:cytochrome bd-type quinol oxidase subunit 1
MGQVGERHLAGRALLPMLQAPGPASFQPEERGLPRPCPRLASPPVHGRGCGLYGVTAYSVGRRRSEIGIWMALGAKPAVVVRMVVARVAVIVGLGIAIGAVLSFWAAQFIEKLLFGLRPRDPLTIAIAAVILAAIGIAAGWIPARRATRIEPAEVLREG